MTEKNMGSLFKPVFETFYTLKIQDSITSAVSANKAKTSFNENKNKNHAREFKELFNTNLRCAVISYFLKYAQEEKLFHFKLVNSTL